METEGSQSISTLLKKYNLRPRKSLGQNFLIDSFHLAKIVEVADLTLQDTVLEIGPGPGALTRLLAEAAGQAIAVELDPNLVNLLENEFGHLPNLTIVAADILQMPIDTLIPHPLTQNSQTTPTNLALPTPRSAPLIPATRPYKVVANLPYYITSAVLRYLMEETPRPDRVVVTVQKEVAQRIVAEPGNMSLLAVSVQFYGQPTLVHRIPAGAFYPPPKVDSAVVRIDTFAEPPLAVADVNHFFRVVKAGFSQKRKQLKNSLSTGLGLPAAKVVTAMQQVNIDPTRRAETLSLAEWDALARELW